MINFKEWLSKIEESTIWHHPNLTAPESQFSGRPNIGAIEQFIQQMIAKNSGYDPVQGMGNIAANSTMYKEPDSYRGDAPPLNWKLLGHLRQWGFVNQEQFYNWWSQGGREVVAQMRDKLLAQASKY